MSDVSDAEYSEEYWSIFGEVLGDEAHMSLTLELLQNLPSSARELIDSGELTIEQVATMASLVVSKELTDRYFESARLAGSTAIKLLPSTD